MKNEEVILDIIDYGSNFEGIARIDNKVVFVNDALKGEKIQGKIIKENSSYMIAKNLNVITSSKYRVEPFCEVYKRCGGCLCQHIDYNETLKIKKNNIKNLLEKYNVEYGVLNDVIGQGIIHTYEKVSEDNAEGERTGGFGSTNG